VTVVAAAPARLCLVMIVRDEERVLGRCLASCAAIVDAACVCDTGSKDATVEVARAFGEERGIPVEVPRHEWRDFGHNRTRALQAGGDFVRRLGWDPARTWFLLLDADQVLGGVPAFDRGSLSAAAYSIPQRSGSASYWNTRLLRADLPWSYAGATHEHVVSPPGARVERLDSISVEDRNDGGSRGDKFPRDLKLLTAELERDPRNPRTLFYLARTYRALGDRLRALSLFRRRIEAGGWTEEVWHSWFAMAEMQFETGGLREARAALLAAIRVEPRRAEAQHLLARVHRASRRMERAAAAASRGLARDFPSACALFVDRRPYDWGLREELALAAAETRHREEGFAAAEAMLLDRAAPRDAKERVRRALVAYADPFAGAEHVRLEIPWGDPWVPCNPCVVPWRDGFLVNVRAVNYRQRDARDYRILDKDGVVRTRNALVRLGPDLAPLSTVEVTADGLPPARPARIAGFEDVRLLPAPDGLLAIATTADRHPSGLVGPSLLRLSDEGRVLSHVPLVPPGKPRVEKNWLPFLDEASGDLRLLYALDPRVVLSVDRESGECRVVEHAVPAFDLSRWRNSAGPVALSTRAGAGRLWITHEAVGMSGRRRRYLHRFAWEDAAGKPVLGSRAFTFRGPGIEFAAGMCLDGDGRSLLVSYGVEDREAWVARLPLEAVRAALRPLETGMTGR
jgi:tetratricopeptide (TPR) repeat protein